MTVGIAFLLGMLTMSLLGLVGALCLLGLQHRDLGPAEKKALR